MSPNKKDRGLSVVLLVFAAVIAVVGFVNAAEGPTCGSRAMSPGDTCYFDGKPSSYQDRRTAAQLAPLWNTAIAVVLVGFAVGSWLKGGRGGRDPAAATGPRSTTTPPRARTSAEAHLAVSISPCDCGGTGFISDSALFQIDGGFVRRYSGACPSCGTQRELLFRIPDEPLTSRPGEVRFGDGTPSELLDPGMWLLVADTYARLVPGDTSGLDDASRPAARRNMATAAAAMDEVIAFLPQGASAVPAGAFFTPAGRQIRDREPGRFGRARLEAVRNTYRQILAETTQPPADRPTGPGQ